MIGPLLLYFDRNLIVVSIKFVLKASWWFFNRKRMIIYYVSDFSANCVYSRLILRFSNPPNETGRRKERRGGRSAKMRKNKGRKKKRDRRSEEEESRYHNIAVIPGSVSFQIIQKPADRTYIPGPTRSSYHVIIVEGPNRPWIAECPQWWSTSYTAFIGSIVNSQRRDRSIQIIDKVHYYWLL